MAVEFSLEDHVATVTLARPEVHNAYDMDMRRELQAAWARIRSDDEVWVAIITGAGERAFCAGQDIKGPRPNAEGVAHGVFWRGGADALVAGLATDKPLIAAVNGLAYGGGLEIALACDIRLAADSARFALSEVRIAGIPGAGGTQRLPRLIGRSDAMRMLLTGKPMSAQDAYRSGLVSEIVPLPELMPLARTIAADIAENGQLAVRAVKRLASLGLDMPLSHGLDFEAFVSGVIRETEDIAEGRRAFKEKRKPQYKGR
ncbi:MAG: enoyl-CoA hydratase/isomerase family protein [Burkholderiales bacterium]|nr:enoyl-CoA hydratase/isomerase family protein [Burkholderiales bacterium]